MKVQTTMQLEPCTQEAICEALEIWHLQAGIHRENHLDRQSKVKFWTEYIWVAVIQGYYWRDVILGVMATKPRWKADKISYTAFLIVKGWEENSFLKSRPFRAISLGDFDDRVSIHLRQMNMLPPMKEVVPDKPQGNSTFDIYTFVDYGRGSLTFGIGQLPDDSNSRELWQELLSLTKNLGETHADPEVRAFFARGPMNI
jgi:hypothetical protein